MAQPQPTPPISYSVLAVVVGAAFCMTVAGSVVIAVAVPESGNPSALIALLLGALATFVPAVLGLVVGTQTRKTVNDLANGQMDEKIRRGVNAVLDAREAAGQPLPVQLVGDPAPTVTYPDPATQPQPETPQP